MTPSPLRRDATLVDFLQEEAPLEYERLKSIGQLASLIADVEATAGSDLALVCTMGPRCL